MSCGCDRCLNYQYSIAEVGVNCIYPATGAPGAKRPKDTATATATAARDIIGDIAPDMVNHPPHYTAHPSGVECITVTEHMNFNVGNATKYLWRQGQKGSGSNVEDLRKAVWYINREIQRLEGIK